MSVLEVFSPAVRDWFEQRFGAPSPPQEMGWPHLARGGSALLIAPTGSGKTLAAFLAAIDRLHRDPPAEPGVRVVYVSPLKALSSDIHRNLQEPLEGIARAAGRAPQITVALRTGDTPQHERAKFGRNPAHVLVTTPESLFLLLGTEPGRAALVTTTTVIVDEVHALAGTKRGAHLTLSLERLERLCGRALQRVGCSATVRPADEIASWLGGLDAGTPRPVAVFDAGLRKDMDLAVVSPVPDMRALAGDSIWPAVENRLLDEIRRHRSTLVFTNDRRSAERLTARINDLAGEELVRVHHGSISRERRLETEQLLVEGRLPGIIATSSLELGIDVGTIDLVVQVRSPKSVARGLQRVGRAGHLLGETSVGRVLPLFRQDVVDAAVCAHGMLRGEIEATRIPRNCLDVLAQQVVAAAAVEPWRDEDLWLLARGAWNFRDLPRAHIDEVLRMVSGGYSAARFGGLVARVTWNRESGLVEGKPGARRLVAENAGAIVDRGQFAVVHAGTGARLGALDEEFVFETRPGDSFVLGSAIWRIESVGTSDVTVSEAPDALPRLPFWRGEAFGRTLEGGRRHGAFLREAASRLDDPDILEWLRETSALDDNAALTLRTFLLEMRESAGAIPDDRTIVVEVFRDQMSDHRVVIHSPWGERIHMGWAFAIRQRVRAATGLDVEMVASDDGMMIRWPSGDEPPPLDEILGVDAATVEDLLTKELDATPLFGMLFREAAARALVLPRKSSRGRTPLHLQRLRSQDLLQIARRQRAFPLLLEAYREALDERLDVAALTTVLRAIDAGEIQIAVVETDKPSPFASSFLFEFTGALLYAGDQPRAEWRSRFLTFDRELLAELLGKDELRTLLDRRAIAEVAGRVARWAADHPEEERAFEADRARGDHVAMLRRWARAHGPFRAEEFVLASGLSDTAVEMALATLQAEGTLVAGGFTPGRTGREWCDAENLREIHRRSLTIARRDVEPVDPEVFASFLLDRHGIGTGRAGSPAALRDALERLEGAPVQAEAIEQDVLAARLRPYDPAWLDALCAEGALAWQGAPRGRVVLAARAGLPTLSRAPEPPAPGSPAAAVLDALRARGPSFLTEVTAATALDERDAIEALWALAWNGAVTNDRFEPLRKLRGGRLPPPPVVRLERARSTLRRMMAARQIAVAPAAGGRWAAMPAVESDTGARPEAWALAMLRRYGVVAREMHAADACPVAWEAVRAVLDRWEATGEVRRGYFVRGLSGAQFAMPDAVERLRAHRPARTRLVAAVDPANAYGTILPLPADRRIRFARVPASALVVRGGRPLLLVERRGKRLVPLRDDLPDEALRECFERIEGLLRSRRKIEVERFGDAPVHATRAAALLADVGYEATPRAMVLRAPVR